MTFAFRKGEALDVGTRRLAREGAQLVLAALGEAALGEAALGEAALGEAALGEAALGEKEAVVSVHEARRTIKRLRALARLVGAREAQPYLRSAAHDFAGSRDAHVIVETFDRIGGRDSELRKTLVRAKKKTRPDVDDVKSQLSKFASSIDEWVIGDGWLAIEPGIHRTYRAGRRALAEEPHELRKRVKDLQFQLTLIRAAFPQVIGGYLSALRELGALLGDEHDLAVLAGALVGHDRYLATIAEEREKLGARIMPLAARVYVDKPRVWTSRLARWWSLSTRDAADPEGRSSPD